VFFGLQFQEEMAPASTFVARSLKETARRIYAKPQIMFWPGPTRGP